MQALLPKLRLLELLLRPRLPELLPKSRLLGRRLSELLLKLRLLGLKLLGLLFRLRPPGLLLKKAHVQPSKRVQALLPKPRLPGLRLLRLKLPESLHKRLHNIPDLLPLPEITIHAGVTATVGTTPLTGMIVVDCERA